MNERLRFGQDSVEIRGSTLKYDREGGKTLTACRKIDDPNLIIGVISNNNLLPQRFVVGSEKDREPIRLPDPDTGQSTDLNFQGKSAFLFFGYNSDKASLARLVNKYFDREITRHDHLHLATVGWIEEAGWQAWWAPIPARNNWLHVRLIAASTIEHGTDPTPEEAQALSEVFVKAF